MPGDLFREILLVIDGLQLRPPNLSSLEPRAGSQWPAWPACLGLICSLEIDGLRLQNMANMRVFGTAILLAALSSAPAAGQTCYECVVKHCAQGFTATANRIEWDFEQELAEVKQQFEAMDLTAAGKAEVVTATAAVLRSNAEEEKKLAYNELQYCLVRQ